MSGTLIYPRNCLAGNRSIKSFLLSLQKDADVIIGRVRPKKLGVFHSLLLGENTKPFFVGTGLESKFIDVAPSAIFKTKEKPTEG